MRKRSKKARAQAEAQARFADARARYESARDQLAPTVSGAVSTTRDRVQPVVDSARERLGPMVGTAIEKATPVVESARDKVVDDLLPRLAEAATAAAGAAASARDNAVESAQEKAAEAARNLPRNKRRRRRRRLLLLTMLTAGGAAAYTAFKARRNADSDPWSPASSGTSSPVVNGSQRPVEVPPPVATAVLPEDVAEPAVVDEPSLDGVLVEDVVITDEAADASEEQNSNPS